jgi:hypothetical protein
MEPPFEHEPGSPEAIAQGCTCPPQAGPTPPPTATPGFFVCDWQCPMHGVDVAERALEAGEARTIGSANDDERIGH